MRSTLRKWGLIAFGIGAIFTAMACAFVLYGPRPEQEVVVVMPAVPPTATPVPYFPATGPDLSLPRTYPTPLEVPRGPHASSTLELHLGPSQDYAVIGTLQKGAQLQVVGRDETSEWLAIVFPPNSTLRAWLPATQVSGLLDIETLPVEQVRMLQ